MGPRYPPVNAPCHRNRITERTAVHGHNHAKQRESGRHENKHNGDAFVTVMSGIVNEESLYTTAETRHRACSPENNPWTVRCSLEVSLCAVEVARSGSRPRLPMRTNA